MIVRGTLRESGPSGGAQDFPVTWALAIADGKVVRMEGFVEER